MGVVTNVLARYKTAISVKLHMGPFLVGAFTDIVQRHKGEVLDLLLSEREARDLARAAIVKDPGVRSSSVGAKARRDIVQQYAEGEVRAFEEVLTAKELYRHMVEVLRKGRVPVGLDPAVFFPRVDAGRLTIRFQVWGGLAGAEGEVERMVHMARALDGQIEYTSSVETNAARQARYVYDCTGVWPLPLHDLVDRVFGPLIEARVREAFINERFP